MVVVPEPAVKCGCAFAACAVDRAVGPACEEGADKAFCLSVGLWPVGPGAEVADPEPVAGERVHGCAVGGAVVGQHPFDADAVSAVEGVGASEEADRRRGALVGQHLGVGQPAVVVDRDVHELPPGDPTPATMDPGLRLAGAAAADPVADAADTAEL